MVNTPRRPNTRPPLSAGSSSGFTLIEVMVVVTLIVILASMGLTGYRNSIQHAKEATLKEDLFRMREAIDQYYADKNSYPAGLVDLVSAGYIRDVPQDPMTGSRDTWQTTQAEGDINNPTAESGVYDVKSGSDQVAIDGTRYSDWD